MSLTTATITRAVERGVPLVFIRTTDQAATTAAVVRVFDAHSVVGHDIVRGLHPLARSAAIVQRLAGDDPRVTSGNPTEALELAARLPENAILVCRSAHEWMNNPASTDALDLLRDPYKASNRCVVMLGPNVTLPAKLTQSVVVIDDPLPDIGALTDLAVRTAQAAEVSLGEDVATHDRAAGLAADACVGLNEFAAEQALALTLEADGYDLDALWEAKRRAVNETKGLRMEDPDESFDNLRGNAVLRDFLTDLAQGERPFKGVFLLDELEKTSVVAGKNDSTGTGRDLLGYLLSEMQDRDVDGVLLYGPPGTSKTALAKATARKVGVPFVKLDIGAMTTSLLGETGQAFRAAWRTIMAMSQGLPLIIGTCNSVADLPPELGRRFSLGRYFLDLPTTEERAAIWEVYVRKYELYGQDLPPDDGWTGAEIRNCARLAWRLRRPLAAAAQSIVPVAVSCAVEVERLRREAHHRFLSASAPGLYEYPDLPSNGVAEGKTRRVSVS